MGISANEAVNNFKMKSAQAPLTDDDETSDDEGESSDEDDDFADKSTGDERVVGDLLSRIASWQHVQAPIH